MMDVEQEDRVDRLLMLKIGKSLEDLIGGLNIVFGECCKIIPPFMAFEKIDVLTLIGNSKT